MKNFDLINSQYSNKEAFEVLYELLTDKIAFLGRKIHGDQERGLITTKYEQRRSELLAVRDKLRAAIDATADGTLEVVCRVEIKNA